MKRPNWQSGIETRQHYLARLSAWELAQETETVHEIGDDEGAFQSLIKVIAPDVELEADDVDAS